MFKKIGIAKDKSTRQYNLIDLTSQSLIACSHGSSDSALCDSCYGRFIKEAEEIQLIEGDINSDVISSFSGPGILVSIKGEEEGGE